MASPAKLTSARAVRTPQGIRLNVKGELNSLNFSALITERNGEFFAEQESKPNAGPGATICITAPFDVKVEFKGKFGKTVRVNGIDWSGKKVVLDIAVETR